MRRSRMYISYFSNPRFVTAPSSSPQENCSQRTMWWSPSLREGFCNLTAATGAIHRRSSLSSMSFMNIQTDKRFPLKNEEDGNEKVEETSICHVDDCRVFLSGFGYMVLYLYTHQFLNLIFVLFNRLKWLLFFIHKVTHVGRVRQCW